MHVSDSNIIVYQQNLKTKTEVKEEDFVYRLVTEKAEYSEREAIKLYAELEYIGDQEEIEISYGGSPFSFPMVETTRNYEIDYLNFQVLKRTKLIKGESLRQEYLGSGGFGAQDEKEYIEFMKQVTNNKFPKGHYVVNGSADFNVIDSRDSIEKKNYEIKAQIEFRVE